MRQSLSFHRLRDASVARRIVASTGLAPPALVYEFGAGDGLLTAALAPHAGRVIAVEVDRLLHFRLSKRVSSLTNVHPLHADFRDVVLPAKANYAVVANLPFSLTAATLRRLTGGPNPPTAAFLVVQREVAATWSGSARGTVAATLAQLQFSFDVPLALRRRDFDPWPRVESVLLAIRKRPAPLLAPSRCLGFAAFVQRGFLGGRPTLERNLRGVATDRSIRAALRSVGAATGAAASSLSIEQWLRLWKLLGSP
jgi:16S rRNA A1518/A1519 N6-dimethyltransferase RsmA/KsgA/DIM1 with predicted DNA glycosylase/AP lyase activity